MISKYCAKIINVWSFPDPIVEVMHSEFSGTSLPSSEGPIRKFGNKCVKILKFLRTELSYAQNKNRGEKMGLLGMDTCPSLNEIMEIRCNKCTRSERGTIFKPAELHALWIISIYKGAKHVTCC
jgi:hypothetical protein